MKLCNYCVMNILESRKSWDYHHDSYAALQKSHEWDAKRRDPKLQKKWPKEHCLFCTTLHADIQSLAPSLAEAGCARRWPVYRWSIRALSQIRESLETVVVTFRYVMPEGKEGEKLGLVELPTRTFFLFPESEVQPLPSASELGDSTDPTLNGGEQIQAWIDTCNTTHEECKKQKSKEAKSQAFVPTRLLDISGPKEAPIRLIETGKTSVKSPYCSVSHCWGTPNFIQLRTGDKKLFMEQGVDFKLLPRNFQEAITIARSLNVNFIWCDSLCIQQDSEEDWKFEATRMHLVYRNSYCNIAIVDSPDSSGGAFRSRNPEDVVPIHYKASDRSPFFGNKMWVVVPENLWASQLLDSFLYRRGWVFQERMLSPRILHFAKNQIFWDCPSMSACETVPGGLPRPMDNAAGPDRRWRGLLQATQNSQEVVAGPNDQSLETFWQLAVQDYTSCNLTMGKDKLIAMWGIAKLVRDGMKVEYGDGLWEENLEDQLAWRVEECTLAVRPSDSTDEKKARNIPSWSWASMDGRIIISDRLSDQAHYKVKDHDGHSLTFDLVGVKPDAHSSLDKDGKAAPRMPSRGVSDTSLELLRRDAERTKDEPHIHTEKDFHRSKVPEKMDRDKAPEFHSKSIRIQGHVNQGRLRWDEAKKGWQLEIEEVLGNLIEAFPDLVPTVDDSADQTPYFVVLAAKQVIRQSEALFGFQDTHDASIDYAGHGILMKTTAKPYHYQRTGAFRFRNLSGSAFEQLRRTKNWETLSSEVYQHSKGCKFWLD